MTAHYKVTRCDPVDDRYKIEYEHKHDNSIKIFLDLPKTGFFHDENMSMSLTEAVLATNICILSFYQADQAKEASLGSIIPWR